MDAVSVAGSLGCLGGTAVSPACEGDGESLGLDVKRRWRGKRERLRHLQALEPVPDKLKRDEGYVLQRLVAWEALRVQQPAVVDLSLIHI